MAPIGKQGANNTINFLRITLPVIFFIVFLDVCCSSKEVDSHTQDGAPDNRDADNNEDSDADSDTGSDCKECEEGFFCSTSGKCIQWGKCISDTDCKCNNSECEAEHEVCVSTNGGNLCGECETGTFCSTRGECIPLDRCLSNEDCICDLSCETLVQRCMDANICAQYIVTIPHDQTDAGVSPVCTIALEKSEDCVRSAPGMIQVYFDDTLVPESKTNGWAWAYDESHMEFILNGSFCEMLQYISVVSIYCFCGY
ncbi:MAG: hypothetical protein GY847_27140 [Proteobacteria bacterium]|nr:hypothetical protein [Pseudomonadota bacterium]